MATRPPIHAILYSPAGGYKSHMAASFPKDMLVLGFDPLGKMMPYTKRGIASPELVGEFDQGLVLVSSKNSPDRTIVQIELFHDDRLNDDGSLDPTAYSRFLKRMPSLYEEVRAGKWRTVVIDSITAMALASKNMHQYSLHKHEKDSRKWFAQATDDLEQAICCRLSGALRGINFLILCHVDHEKDDVAGMIVGTLAAPGRLRVADGLPARFPEMYRLHTKREKDGEMKRWVQTQPDARYNAMSAINAPDGCEPDYKALWSNYDAERA